MLITIKDILLLIYSVNDSQTLQKAVGWKSWVDKVDESGHLTTKYDYDMSRTRSFDFLLRKTSLFCLIMYIYIR